MLEFRCPKIAFYCTSGTGWCELPLHHKMCYSKGLGRMSGRGHCAGSGSSFLAVSLPGASADGSKGLTTVRASAHQEEVGIWVTSSVSRHLCHPESDPPAQCPQQPQRLQRRRPGELFTSKLHIIRTNTHCLVTTHQKARGGFLRSASV